MKSYSAFADVYDLLMSDVDYRAWTDYIEQIFEKYNIKPRYIAELACGTGNITNLLAKRGYDLIGTDLSLDMLYKAKEKALAMKVDVIYLQQDMRTLSLPSNLDVILCVCDGINYILEDKELYKVFSDVYKDLKNGGLFIFDLSSYYKLSYILGNQTYCENLEEVSYIWENDFDEETMTCDLDLTLFIKEDSIYRKYVEYHTQRAYKEKEIIHILKKVGFCSIDAVNAFTFEKTAADNERIYFICRK